MSRRREILRRHLREMEQMLLRHGYHPSGAAILQHDGMGPCELEFILTRPGYEPGAFGSLEYHCGIKRI